MQHMKKETLEGVVAARSQATQIKVDAADRHRKSWRNTKRHKVL